jgi:hypothetical protein
MRHERACRSLDATRLAALLGAIVLGLVSASVASLAGCAARPPKAAKIAEPEPPTPKSVDPSYDWHGLLPAPFGSYLKEVPLALHEVLLFRDEAHGAGSADEADCYGSDTPAPRFVGGTPDEYLMCFTQDRLARLQVSVSVSTEQAPEIFATACALWLKNAAQPAAAASSDAQTTSTCEGRDGAVHFSGRLGAEPGADRGAAPSTAPVADTGAETPLRVVLDAAPDPKTQPE